MKRFFIVMSFLVILMLTDISSAKESNDNILKKELEELKASDQKQDKNKDIVSRIQNLNPKTQDYRNLDTKDLLELCLNNPYRTLFFLYDDPLLALKILEDNYEPLATLKSRSDYLNVLIKVEKEERDYREKKFIEVLLFDSAKPYYDEVLNKIYSIFFRGCVYPPKGSAV